MDTHFFTNSKIGYKQKMDNKLKVLSYKLYVLSQYK